MKVAFFTQNYYTAPVLRKNNKQTDANNICASRPIMIDTVSFGRTAKNAEAMRRLFKYKMIDIHTGQPLIDPEWFEKALQNGLFEKQISTIVRAITPLEDCLHPVEAQIFKEIKKYAQSFPMYKLTDVIQILVPKAQEELDKLQHPIINYLKVCGKFLPPEQQSAFNELMENTDKQLKNKAIEYKFSKKEFKYKLERIFGDIKRKGIQSEIKTMQKLIAIASKLPYIPSGRNFLRRDPEFDPKRMFSQAAVIRQMDKYFQRSNLKDNKELQDLFASVNEQLFNRPIKVPFKRKSFIHELQSITDTIEDTKLARKMVKEACKLPTAQEETSAFIMKMSRASATKIGHDLLYGSVGAIDHLDPYSKGGIDAIENYGFTSNAMNSKRGNTIMQKWIKQNPMTKIGSQKCVDKLFELEKQGILKKEGFSIWYTVAFAKKMRKLTKNEIDLYLNFALLNR